VDFGFLCKAVNPSGIVCRARKAVGRDAASGIQRVRFCHYALSFCQLSAPCVHEFVWIPLEQLQYLVEASEDHAEFVKRVVFEAEKLFGYPLGGGYMDRASVSGTSVMPPSSPARRPVPLRQVTFRFVDGTLKTLELSDDMTVAEVKRQLNVGGRWDRFPRLRC
jgi:hypothetical protein